jgi:hypothetical protein
MRRKATPKRCTVGTREKESHDRGVNLRTVKKFKKPRTTCTTRCPARKRNIALCARELARKKLAWETTPFERAARCASSFFVVLGVLRSSTLAGNTRSIGLLVVLLASKQ